MEIISICFLFFIFLFTLRIRLFFLGVRFLIYDYLFIFEFELFSLNRRIVVFLIFFDWIRLIFMSFVLLISRLVIYYRKDYIYGDLNINRFILIVLLFVFSIIILIISPNLIRILLGWDGLGLVSYCLVIYYQNVKSYNAGILTALSNRLGDVAFLLAIAWILNYGRWNFLFYIEFIKFDFEIQFISFLVIFAAITKRAQIPFSSWLPAAMAAPTPVSALVHSSTLVTAGVYLLIRFNYLFFGTVFSNILLLISGLTMFIAGLGANFEFDLKKIIALSTLSQLGLMIRTLSLGLFKLAFFHLLTHALFKALLFICAGAVIHNIKNSQDIRDIGSLIINMPFTISCLNVANLALCGLPFLAGFYSKDLILEITLIININLFSLFLFFFSTGLTVMYSFRLFYYSIIINLNSSSINIIRDSSLIIRKRMLGLLIFAIIGGSFLNWLIFPFSFILSLTKTIKFLTLVICFLGGISGFLVANINFFSFNKSLSFYFFSYFFSRMWFIPMISTIGINFFPIKSGLKILKSLDQGWVEYFGIQQFFSYFINFSKISQGFQLNNLKIYFSFFVFWISFLVLLILIF